MSNDPFPIAVHYYRQPTPLPSEWREDFPRIKDMGINMIQFRPQWRWHERVRGQFRWDDLDELFDLAGEYELKVVLKFMLETAPEWVYDDLNAVRINPDGSQITPHAIGAFYIGGWLPCFDVPEVQEAAARFVEALVQRYRNQPALAWWHAWNEPRSRPMGECACTASAASYRRFLKQRYGTIEALNEFLGKCWASFEQIKPPANVGDYAEMFLWRQWAATSVTERVKLVADTARKHDPNHPVMAHAGCCSMVQDTLKDTCDDVAVAGVVDLFGSSLASELDGEMGPEMTGLNCDWIRSVNHGRPWWINEAYSDPCVTFRKECKEDHIRHIFLTPIAHGASGIMMWQYRGERYGLESLDNGLVTPGGEETCRSDELKRVSAFLQKHGALFKDTRVDSDRIAIVYDFCTDLLSAIEGECEGLKLEASHPYGLAVPYAYKRALQGAYTMFYDAGYQIDVIDSRSLDRLADGYDLVYLPLPFFVREAESNLLLDFVRRGGLLVAEAGWGMRQENTWLALRAPGPHLESLGYRHRRPFRLKGTRLSASLLCMDGQIAWGQEYFDVLEPTPGGAAEIVGTWSSNDSFPDCLSEQSPAALSCPLGRGRALVLAFSPGLAYLAAKRDNPAHAFAAAAGIQQPAPLQGSNVSNVIARRLITSDGRRMSILRNAGSESACVSVESLKPLTRDIWEGTRREGNDIILPASEFGVFVE